jgi:hypothetical protein
MSSTIPELGDNLSGCRQQYQTITYHKTLLPEPATKMGISGVCSGEEKEGTFSVDPQERRRHLPLFENATLEKPGSCSIVMGLACNIMICRGIRGREPVPQFLCEVFFYI